MPTVAVSDIDEVGSTADAFTQEGHSDVVRRLLHVVEALAGILVGEVAVDEEVALPLQVAGSVLHVRSIRAVGRLDEERDRLEVVVITSVVVITGALTVHALLRAVGVGAVAGVQSVTSPQHHEGEEAQAQDVHLEAGHP